MAIVSVRISEESGNFNDYSEYNVELPDKCPYCYKSIVPTTQGQTISVETEEDWENTLEVVYKCNSEDCGKLFIGYYNCIDGWEGPLELEAISFGNPPKKEFPQSVIKISKRFVEIYNQALAAEDYGLNQVCGMGYRKALEFLIKDHLVKTHAPEKEKIENMYLGTCINKYINDDRIKAVATRAAWLGNDESHYVREWKNNDIHDLKQLIDIVVNQVDGVELTKKYIKEMPSKK